VNTDFLLIGGLIH